MYSLGIDIGTSGIRAVIMDANHCILAQAQSVLPQSQAFYSSSCSKKKQIIGYSQTPGDWWSTLEKVIFQLSDTLYKNQKLNLDIITHLAIDGTSGTVLLCDSSGKPVTDALMYNDQRAVLQAQRIKTCAPDNTAAIGTTSGLAKILWLFENHSGHYGSKQAHKNAIHYALNQSDWLSGKLMGKYGISDHNNALKMGYDAQAHCWPKWLLKLLEQANFSSSLLPEVISPGQIMAQVAPEIATHFGFSPKLSICAGTTDSTAAIIASGANNIGDAVTSLGSTLVMKIVSEKAIFDPESGVYSQPFRDLWLVGGSSNSGGEVLKQFFSIDEISQLTETLNTKITQGKFSMLDLNYYPLSTSGERFPIQDPYLKPQLSPRPQNNCNFFQALLEGMADIETMAYHKLVDLGASYPKLVISIGGGAANKAWCYIREQKLDTPVEISAQEQAAAGSALLAQTTW